LSDTGNDIHNLIDRSVKRLFRDQPQALLRLAGVRESAVRFEDTSLNIPELHADHVFIVEEEGEPEPYALYLEYQLKPDASLLPIWALKWSGLCRQLPMQVVLLAIYLERGKRATFPAAFRQRGGRRLRTTLSFDTVRLWDHRDRIVSGEWPELAPLLVLCDAPPTEQTLRQEVAIIHGSGLPRAMQAELLGVAVAVASRRFGQDVLEAIFAGELEMLDEEETLTELFFNLGLAQKWAKKWIRDPRIHIEELDEARLESRAEGEAAGRAETARQMTLTLLTQRFGELPVALAERIKTADPDTCQRLFDRAISASSLAELADTV
jgi:hypothetical protein